MDFKWLLCITVFAYISIEPSWSRCEKSLISYCNYTVTCTGRPEQIAGDNCGISAYYTFILTNSVQAILSTSYFSSTNFDTRVRYILASENTWSTIDASAFRYYYNCIQMNLSNNQISKIENEAFKNLQSLKFLDLSRNSIEKLMPNSFLIQRNYIKELNLSYNKLTDITTGLNDLRNLTKLFLHNNKLESISDDSFQNLKELTHLYLQQNRLTTLNATLATLKKLITLDLSDNYLVKLSGFELNRLGSIIHINLSHNALSSVESNCFNQAFNLKEVDFSYNNIRMNIESVMFINNNNLQYLDFFNNHITGLHDNFLKYTVVNYLNLNNNNISGDIKENTFSGLRHVIELELTNQNITAIRNKAFSDMNSLLRLNLSRNGIESTENSSFVNTSIRILDLSYNKVQDLSFLKNCLTNLTEFIMSNNNIQIIKENAFEDQKQILNLDLSMNNILRIEEKSLPLQKLQFLNIAGNQLNGIVRKNVFSPAKYLRFLDLTNFNITKIDDIAFIELPLLARLNLSHNQIENIEPSNFKGVNNMYSLDVSHNKLTNFKISNSTLTGLKALYLNNNNLTNISGTFPSNFRLLFLDVSNNNIKMLSDIGFETFPNLTTLNLAQNNIKNFNNPKMNTLSSLMDLRLSSNELITINLSYFKDLTSVDLSNNNLTYINSTFLYNVENLQSLDMSGNKIQILPPGTFQYMKNLKYLNLSTNFLTKLRFGSLKGLHKTEVLDLSKNNITSLDVELFHECSELNTLIIDYNQIKSMDIDRLLLFTVPKLRTLSLGGNPISCREIFLTIKSSYPTEPVTRRIEVTSIDKVYHEDNVQGIKCGDDEIYRVTTSKPETNTPQVESDTSSSTIVIIWCSVLTIVLIGIGVLIYVKFYNIRYLAFPVTESLRTSLELDRSEFQSNLLD